MDKSEAKSAAKAIYLQSASLAGFEVGPFSAERIAEMIDQGFENVREKRRPEAVANVLRVIAATLEVGQKLGVQSLGEETVDEGKSTVCPVYPFD